MVVISYIKDEVERDEFYAAAFMDSGADGVCDCGAPVAPTVVSALPDGFGVTMVCGIRLLAVQSASSAGLPCSTGEADLAIVLRRTMAFMTLLLDAYEFEG
jgi:hypothetical protein